MSNIEEMYNQAVQAQAEGVPVNWHQLCLTTLTSVKAYLEKLSAEHKEENATSASLISDLLAVGVSDPRVVAAARSHIHKLKGAKDESVD